jgi:3-hydroxyisobutyrate dehydrogenase-like beta-hydroxyacid dehydrogenase
VVGYDAWKPSMHRYSAGGGVCSSSPEECGQDADVLVLMVVNAAQAQQVLFQQCVAQGRGGPASYADLLALPFGASVILMSTVAPSQAIDLSERLREVRGDLSFFDAPVSGGTPRAATGDLTILCAGPVKPNVKSGTDGYAKAYSVLEALSTSRGNKENLIYVPGGPGMGAAVKMVNQHLAGCHISSTAEALAFAARLGLPLRLARTALLSGPAESWMMGHRGKHMLDGLLQPPTSMIDIFVKDMDIVVDEASRLSCAVPLASHVRQQFILGKSCGWGKDDDSR